MEFLGIGYQEILVILVLLLVVVGPDRLPEMAYQIGRAVKTMQKYARAVRDEFSEEFEYLEEQYQTARGDFDEARRDLERGQRELDRDIQHMDREMQQAANDIDQSMPEEVRKDGRGNVVPISAAASQQQSSRETRPTRPGERPSRAAPGERKLSSRPAAAKTTPAKPAVNTSARPARSTSANGSTTKDKPKEETAEKPSGPPLVF